MNLSENGISPRQFAALGFVSVLSPLIRRVPASAAEQAGGAAWISVLFAGAVWALLFSLCLRAREKCSPGAHGTLSRVVGAVYGLWFVVLASFILRSGADRLVSTIYPAGGGGVFVITMLLAALAAAWGRLKTLARAAMLFRPVLIAVLAAVFLAALPHVELRGLWQPGAAEEAGVLTGAAEALSPLGVSLYLFFAADESSGKSVKRQGFLWLGVLLAVSELLYITVCGTLGTALTVTVRNPFFAVVRDLTIFGTIEHIEAVVVSEWVFCDFVLTALLLALAVKLWERALGLPEKGAQTADAAVPGKGSSPVSGGGAAVRLAAAALAGALALLVAPGGAVPQVYASVLFPAVNVIMSAAMPAVLRWAR